MLPIELLHGLTFAVNWSALTVRTLLIAACSTLCSLPQSRGLVWTCVCVTHLRLLASGSFLARFWRVGGQAHATNVAPPGFASAMQQLVNTVHWGLARGVGATVGGRILARTNGTRAWHEKLLPTFRLN